MADPKILVIGGLSSSLVNFRAPLLEALKEKGADVHAAAADLMADKDTCAKLQALGVTPHDIPFYRAGMNPVQDLKSLLVAYRLMRKIKPDAVIGYTIKPVVFGTLAAWAAQIPQRIAMITGLGFAFTGSDTTKRALASKVARRLYKLSLRGANTVLFQNPDDRDLFVQEKLLRPTAQITIINGSGVDTTHFAPAPFPKDPTKFLLIARLLSDKGIREYVEAARRVLIDHPDTEFHLAGGADPNPSAIPLDEVRGWVADRTIIWHDHVNDVRPLIRNCHVYVLPSYREGTPRTVLEAMAMRRPIITTDVPGCRETTIDGVNGYLVTLRDAEALAEAMKKILAAPSLIESMASESLKIAQNKYEKSIVAASVINEIHILGQHGHKHENLKETDDV